MYAADVLPVLKRDPTATLKREAPFEVPFFPPSLPPSLPPSVLYLFVLAFSVLLLA
jgi:hypothetical protein